MVASSLQPDPSVGTDRAQRIVVAGMHSPATSWLLNAVLLLLEENGAGPCWIGWAHELPGAELPDRGYVIVRSHDFQTELANSADHILFSGRDLRDAVVALAKGFELTPDLETADYIWRVTNPWTSWASLSLSYESILADAPAALAQISAHLSLPSQRPSHILDLLQASLATGHETPPGHVPPGVFRSDLTPETIEQIEQKHGGWLSRYGYQLSGSAAGLDNILRTLKQPAVLEQYLNASEPRQRQDIRPALFYLRQELARLCEDVPGQLKLVERLASMMRNHRAVLVAWAELLEACGERREAAAKAREALSLFYDDVYTQTVFVRCAGDTNHFEKGKEVFCRRPFENFEIYDDGSVYACNITCVPFPIGNAFTQDAQTIWQSPVAQAIRESILDGSFRFCSPMTCFARFGLPRRDRDPKGFQELKDAGVEGKVGPKELNLSYDRSCNVSCPSCRPHAIMADAGQRKRYEHVRDKVVMPLLETATGVYITGSGDAFGSPHFRGILKQLCDPKYNHVRITLGTNGQLITPRLWQEFAPLHSRFRDITISIDGATPETYERIRRGSSWQRLLEVMDLLKRARDAGTISKIMVNMVVQQDNFREMRPLLELCLGWSVHAVRFYRIRQWGHVIPNQYLDSDVVNPLHPRHGELLEELKHPLFASPIVDRYDMWELIAQVHGISDRSRTPQPR